MSDEPLRGALGAPALEGRPAGLASRLVAFVVDLVTISFATSISAAFVQLVCSFFDVNLARVLQDSPAAAGLLAAGAGLFQLLYFVLGWVVLGQTPGKVLMGLRVVGAHRPKLSVLQALVRYVGYWLSAAALFAGFLWILVDARRETWHDKLARTRVVYASDAYATPRLPGQSSRRQTGTSAIGGADGLS